MSLLSVQAVNKACIELRASRLTCNVASIPIKQLKQKKQLLQALTPAPPLLCVSAATAPSAQLSESVCGVGIFKGVISDPPFSHKSFHVGRMNYLNCNLAGIQNCLEPLLLIFIEIICITEISYLFWSTRIATSETSESGCMSPFATPRHSSLINLESLTLRTSIEVNTTVPTQERSPSPSGSGFSAQEIETRSHSV